MRKPAHRYMGATVLVLAVAAGWFLLRPGADLDPAPGAATAVQATQVPPVPTATAIAVSAGSASQRAEVAMASDSMAQLHARLAASSLRGTQADGELSFDADGRLLPDLGLRRLFDHFLSLSGEFSLADIRRLIADAVLRTHGTDATDAAMAWFERYRDLLRAIDATDFSTDPLARAGALHALRLRHLGEAATHAMFGDEEAALDLALARQRIRAADDLDPTERARWLDELDQTRPDGERAILADSDAIDLAESQTRALDALAADAATRHAERAALWGEDAAERLAQLDAERANWDARVAHYRAARASLGEDPSALVAWLQANFSEAERRRLAALEATGTLPGDPP